MIEMARRTCVVPALPGIRVLYGFSDCTRGLLPLSCLGHGATLVLERYLSREPFGPLYYRSRVRLYRAVLCLSHS